MYAELPPEIHRLILSFCEPPDFVSLGSVSDCAFHISRTRSKVPIPCRSTDRSDSFCKEKAYGGILSRAHAKPMASTDCLIRYQRCLFRTSNRQHLHRSASPRSSSDAQPVRGSQQTARLLLLLGKLFSQSILSFDSSLVVGVSPHPFQRLRPGVTGSRSTWAAGDAAARVEGQGRALE